MAKWEYKSIDLQKSNPLAWVEALNKLGQEDWELVQVVEEGNWSKYGIFKREQVWNGGSDTEFSNGQVPPLPSTDDITIIQSR